MPGIGRQAKPKSGVGIDIGTGSVKIVEIAGQGEKPALVSFGIINTAAARGPISQSIRSLAGELNIAAKEASISVSGAPLIVRLITMPKMTDEELSGAIRFETEKFIPFDISDCILDFQIINKASKDKNSVDILLAAVKKEHVLQKIKTAEEAGFSVKAVDADILALINAFVANRHGQEQAKTAAVLNIGASSTSLGILDRDLPVFVREISAGGSDVTAAVAKKTGLGTEDSERLKLDPKDRAEDVAGCVKAAIAPILEEVKLSFGYYENRSGRGVDDIYVSGGTAQMAGLEEAFQEAFGSKPRHWDPFGFLDRPSVAGAAPLEKAKGLFAVAVGLALR